VYYAKKGERHQAIRGIEWAQGAGPGPEMGTKPISIGEVPELNLNNLKNTKRDGCPLRREKMERFSSRPWHM